MRRRHLYVLLFALPTFLLSIVAGATLLGAAAGALWLFVFGDNRRARLLHSIKFQWLPELKRWRA